MTWVGFWFVFGVVGFITLCVGLCVEKGDAIGIGLVWTLLSVIALLGLAVSAIPVVAR